MFLEINDVDISPYIKSLQPSHESIWNSKAGRSIDSEATFVGRIVARKWKLQAKTIPLSQEKVAKIVGLLEQSDFLVQNSSRQMELILLKGIFTSALSVHRFTVTMTNCQT